MGTCACTCTAANGPFAPPNPNTPRKAKMPSLLDKVGLVMFTSFGTMLIGLAVARAELLPEPARKGVSLLYAKLVFPMMVFRGVAEINLAGAHTRHACAQLCGLLPCCPTSQSST